MDHKRAECDIIIVVSACDKGIWGIDLKREDDEMEGVILRGRYKPATGGKMKVVEKEMLLWVLSAEYTLHFHSKDE